jgi:sugar lactone lactonase YvrE
LVAAAAATIAVWMLATQAGALELGSPRLPAPGPPLTQPQCRDVTASVSVFAGGVPLLDWREELAFDGHGGMWVSRLERNVIERYNPRGAVIKSVAVPGPGGVVLGRDGLLYVNSLPNSGGVAQVVRFDPLAAHPVPTTYVTNLPGVNGSAFDGKGNLYISTEGSAPSVLKIRPNGTRDLSWERAASFAFANGLAVAGPNLYAAVTEDQRSPIERIPLDDPAAHKVIAEESLGVASLEPKLYLPPDLTKPLLLQALDDLAVGPDRKLYVVGFLGGQLLRVDPVSGKACAVVTGLATPTAVQFPFGFGRFIASRDLFVTEASGDVLRVHLTRS